MGNEGSHPTSEKQLNNDIKVNWKKFQKCPFQPREGQSYAVVGKTLYIFGGVICATVQDESGQNILTNYESNDLLKFEFENNRWEEVATTGDIPEGRSGSTLSAIGEKLYLFGGLSENHGWLNDFHMLDTSTMKWSKLESNSAAVPSPRDKLASSVIGTDIFYFGGFGPQQNPEGLENIIEEDDGDDEYEDVEIQEIEQEQQAAKFAWFDDLYKYDTKADTWCLVKPHSEQPTARAAHSMCTIDSDTLIVFGGRDTKGRTNDVWTFEPKTAQWIQMNPLGAKPDPRSFHAAIAVGKRMVVLGGRSVSNQHFRDFHIYDSETSKWFQPQVTGDEIPPATGMHSLAVVGGYVLLCFGASNIDPITHSCTQYFVDTFAVPVEDVLQGGAIKADEPQEGKTEAKNSDQSVGGSGLPSFLGLQQTPKEEPTNGV